MHARVTFRGREALWITWILTPHRGTTEVDLAAQLASPALLSRLVAVAGRRRLRRHLEAVLGTLATLAARAAEDLDDVERVIAPEAALAARRAA